MKRFLAILIIILPLSGLRAAGNFDSTMVVNKVELRASASFTKHFDHHVHLGISEEIRSEVYNSYRQPAYFNRSHTTISLSYKPIQYLSISAGYTLRIQNTKNLSSATKYTAHWSDPKEFIRHRGIVAVTGIYKTRFWNFSLRERLDIDGRMDSVNVLEKNQVDLRLRHRLYAAYTIPGQPVKVFGAVELINTLNQPLAYVNQKLGTNYGQYLSDARVRVGVKWKVDSKNALNFSYRFGYGMDYDVNVTRNKGYVELYRVTSYEHVIGINYEFDW